METSHGSTRTRNANADESSSFSYFPKTVTLNDWWLIKADDDVDGKRLAVAGFTSKENRASRPLYSAPIIKRYYYFTLEAADGIVVVLKGFINKSRIVENGFPDVVSVWFLLGFPPHWEEYAKKCFKQAVNSDTDLPNTVELNESMVEPDVTIRMKSSTINISSPEATLRNLDESITCEESLPRSITGEECNILSQSVIHSKGTRDFSTGNLGVEVDVIAPSTTERDSNSRLGNGHKPFGNVNGIQRPKPLSRCSMKHEGKGLISEAFECLDEENLKRSSKSHVNTPKKVDSDISEAMLRASRRLISLSSRSKSSKKSEHIVPKERVSSSKQARRKITFDIHATPIHERKNRTYIHTPESLSLKRSRSGRLLLPALDFWRNQIPVYDANMTMHTFSPVQDRNVTGVQDEQREQIPDISEAKEMTFSLETTCRNHGGCFYVVVSRNDRTCFQIPHLEV